MAKRRWRRITPEKRREIIRLAKTGMSMKQIGRELDINDVSVAIYLRPYGGVIRPELWNPTSARLSLDERVEIKIGLERGESLRAIGRRLGRDASTICREVNAHGGPAEYKPMLAHRSAGLRARRPKPAKLATNPRLCKRVASDLRWLYSPQQISQRLRQEFGDDPSMNVSHETIYKTLYVQGRGELRKELTRCLRTGRAKRVPGSRMETRGKHKDMVMISERPPEAEDRAVPGHWEGDLLMGQNNKSAIGTLVERSTRYVMLFPLKNGHSAEEVRRTMTKTIKRLPESLKQSLTWDQGGEMAEHVRFRIDTGVEVYFCDPHSPWQRGSNENTNGLLRQYFPKGTDLSKVTTAQLKWAEKTMNDRPRKTLGWLKPKEKLAEFVAFTG